MKIKLWQIILFVVGAILLPMAIWGVLRYINLSPISTEGVNRASWLAFISGYIGAIGTFFLGLVAINQNKSLESQNKKSLEYNERLLLLEEIEKMPVITVVNDDTVHISEDDKHINILITLHNTGKAPITEFRIVNEVDSLNKTVVKNNLEQTLSFAEVLLGHIGTLEAFEQIEELSVRATLSSLEVIKTFLKYLSPVSEEIDLSDLQNNGIVELGDDNFQEWLENQVSICLSILSSYQNTHQGVRSRLAEINSDCIKIQQWIKNHEKVYTSIKSLHEFGKFISSELYFINVNESVMRNIKFPIAMVKNEQAMYSTQETFDKMKQEHGENFSESMRNHLHKIYGVKLNLEFKNIYDTWYEQVLDIEISDGKIKSSALTVKPITGQEVE